MTDADGYGRFHAPGPSDPQGGTYGAPGTYGSPVPDPYAGPAGDPYAPAASDPYGSDAAAQGGTPGYTGPEFGSGALPYGGPPQPQYYAAPPTNGSATAALVLGILSMTCLPLTGPIAIILGGIGMKATQDGTESGRGMAIAGLVLGILGTLYLLGVVLWFVLWIVVAASTSTYA